MGNTRTCFAYLSEFKRPFKLQISATRVSSRLNAENVPSFPSILLWANRYVECVKAKNFSGDGSATLRFIVIMWAVFVVITYIYGLIY